MSTGIKCGWCHDEIRSPVEGDEHRQRHIAEDRERLLERPMTFDPVKAMRLQSLEQGVIDAAIALIRYEDEADRLRLATPHSTSPGQYEISSKEWERFCQYVASSAHNLDFRKAVRALLEEREKQ